MSEPQPQPVRSPFDPEAVQSPVRPGCGKPLAVGCGLVSVLVVAALVLFVTKAPDILRWTIEAMQPEVERRLPADVTDAEQRRLEEAFAAAAARAESGRLDPQALQRLQRAFLAVAGEESLSREDLERFLSALEAFAAAEPEGEGSPPAGGPGP